jgi:hypothetical protein
MGGKVQPSLERIESTGIRDLLTSCWNPNPSTRPTLGTLLKSSKRKRVMVKNNEDARLLHYLYSSVFGFKYTLQTYYSMTCCGGNNGQRPNLADLSLNVALRSSRYRYLVASGDPATYTGSKDQQVASPNQI